MIISHTYFRMRNDPDKGCRENQNTLFHIQLIFSENRAVYEIMWKDMIKPGRPNITM
jgi:hypothetical protein